jgi:hypothetical protein
MSGVADDHRDAIGSRPRLKPEPVDHGEHDQIRADGEHRRRDAYRHETSVTKGEAQGAHRGARMQAVDGVSGGRPRGSGVMVRGSRTGVTRL